MNATATATNSTQTISTGRKLWKLLVRTLRPILPYKENERFATAQFLNVDRLLLKPIVAIEQLAMEMLIREQLIQQLLPVASRPYLLAFCLTEDSLRVMIYETTITGPGARPSDIFHASEGEHFVTVHSTDEGLRYTVSDIEVLNPNLVFNPYEPKACYEQDLNAKDLKFITPQIRAIQYSDSF